MTGTLALLASVVVLASGEPIKVTVVRLNDDYSIGYKSGIKQPKGSYLNGSSVLNVSKRVSGNELGVPNNLVFVDELNGIYSLVTNQPDDQFLNPSINPGGLATFNPFGHIAFVYGARANDLPFDYATSVNPFSADDFDVLWDNFVTSQGSTVPMLWIDPTNTGHFVHRYGGSSWATSKVRYQNWILSEGQQPTITNETDLGSGMVHPFWGTNVGIEQLWTSYDPRYDALLACWQFFRVDTHIFGSNPVVISYDHGATWRAADGTIVNSILPISYNEINSTISPFDHLSYGITTDWHPGDLGLTPRGKPWVTLQNQYQETEFWLWHSGAWVSTVITPPMMNSAKPEAVITTKDYLVCIYGNDTNLYGTFSVNGLNWSVPKIIATVNYPDKYCWSVAIQPIAEYEDNTARFVVGSYNRTHGGIAHNYKYNLDYITVTVNLTLGS